MFIEFVPDTNQRFNMYKPVRYIIINCSSSVFSKEHKKLRQEIVGWKSDSNMTFKELSHKMELLEEYDMLKDKLSLYRYLICA